MIGKWTATAIVALAVVLGATVGIAPILRDGRGHGEADNTSIEAAYVFDVEDKRELMRYADEVFVGEVVAKVATDFDAAMTTWRVAVSEPVKGAPAGDVFVRQLGYVDTRGQTHTTENQALLIVGNRYLLVTTREGGEPVNTLVGGSASTVQIDSADDKRDILNEYRNAMR